jgi:hypothetical protein
MPKGILKLQLQAARSMSRRRLRNTLTTIAMETNRAKNAVVRHWIRWREDNPDWMPAQRRKRDGTLKTKANGEPLLEDGALSQDIDNELYHVARKVSPTINSNIISSAKIEVVSDLKDNVPYNHEGKARFVWQALLSFERSPASYRSLTFPAPNKECRLWYCGDHKPLSPGVDTRIAKYAGNAAVVRFPVWSRDAGYQQVDVVARVSMAKLSKGNRKLLRRIANSELKMSDSHVVCRKGKWYFDLCYEVSPVDHGLDQNQTAVLTMGHGNSFDLTFPDGRCWKLGDDKPLAKEFERITMRRKTLRYRSRYQHGKGHGKQRFYQKLRPHSRRFLDMQDEYRKQLIADIVKSCIKQDCGGLLYREPTMPLRDRSFLAVNGIPFNWSEFAPLLRFKMQCNAIVFNKTRMGVKEWRDLNGIVSSAASQSGSAEPVT